MTPEEIRILASIGRSGWTITSRPPETVDVDEVDAKGNPTGRKAKQPTGNIVWIISDGQGHNQTMVVKPPTQIGVSVTIPDAKVGAAVMVAFGDQQPKFSLGNKYTFLIVGL